jgi:hypothetical protein
VHNLFSKEGIHFSGFRQGRTSMVRASLSQTASVSGEFS